MGLDELKLGPGMLFMTTTNGEDVMQVEARDIYCDIPVSANEEVNYEFDFKTPLMQEFTADSCIVDQSLLRHVMGAPYGWNMEYEADVLVQARKHRKKRINKKWAKRYGYKTIKRKMRFNCDQVVFERDGDTLNITFDTKGVAK